VFSKTALEVLRLPNDSDCKHARAVQHLIFHEGQAHISVQNLAFLRARTACKSGHRALGYLAWASAAASAASVAAARAKLAALAQMSSLNLPTQEFPGSSVTEESEKAWLVLAAGLFAKGQTRLSIRACSDSLLHGVGPLRRKPLLLLGELLDFEHSRRNQMIPSTVVKAPQPWQLFQPGEAVRLETSLEHWDSAGTSPLWGQLALRTCTTVHRLTAATPSEYSGIAEAWRQWDDREPPHIVTCMDLSASARDSLLLVGLQNGWHELRVRLWWQPQGSSAPFLNRIPFCIRLAAKGSANDPCDDPEIRELALSNVHLNQETQSASADGHALATQQQAGTRRRPLCFFTIVVNGMPFLKHHAKVFSFAAKQLGVPWTWHIVEGVALGRANSEAPYSAQVLRGLREDGCSMDGTHEYIQELLSGLSRILCLLSHRFPQPCFSC